MVEYNIFVEGAGKAEIKDAMLYAGYSLSDWSFIVIDEIETAGGTELLVEFDTSFNGDNFVYELELAGFTVSVFEL